MFEAIQAKEIAVETSTDIQTQFDLYKILAEKGVSLLAVSASSREDSVMIYLVVEDSLRAMDLLRDRGYRPREANAVVVQLAHKPGMLKHIVEQLAQEGIGIDRLYATAAGDSDKCFVVLQTTNNEHALPTLNRIGATAVG